MKVPAFVAALLLLPLPGVAQEKMSLKDQQALRTMLQANLAEIELGRLAEQKAESDDVKDLAKRMVEDHGKLAGALQSIAQKKGVTPGPGDPKQQAKARKLAAKRNLDRAYIEDLIRDQQSEVKEVQKIAVEAKDRDLKAVAQRAHPAMQEHLRIAQRIASSNASAGSSARKR